MDKPDIIKSVCDALFSRDASEASNIIRDQYPFAAPSPALRAFSEIRALRIFLRDGFIDRYSGGRLVFPPVLRVVSCVLPKEFPYHKNWKANETHPAYWELFPTLDHVNSIARGG